MGRLTANPELRYTPANLPVVRFSIAVRRSFAKTGEERKTDFFDVVAWRSTEEFVCKYFKKGQLIAIEGSLQTRTYDGNDGIKRKVFEISANNVHFVESKRNDSENSDAEKNFAENNMANVIEENNNDVIELQSDNDLPF
jgi:single-strand DNA-binding protein